MLRKLTSNITGEPYLRDTVTGIEYRRTACALAWPYGDAQGCVLAMGELRNPPSILGARRHLYVLDERRSASPEKLLEETTRLQAKWLFPFALTPDEDPRVILIDAYNTERRRARLPILRTAEPTGWRGKGEGLLPYYMALIQRRITDDKSLHFGDRCTARDETQRAGKDDLGRKMIEMPGACALSWAVENIDVDALPEWHERKQVVAGPADLLGGY
jgi:hypothetical protein